MKALHFLAALAVAIFLPVIASCGGAVSNVTSSTVIDGVASGEFTVLNIERLFDRADECPDSEVCPDDLRPEVIVSTDADGRLAQNFSADVGGITFLAEFEVMAVAGEIVAVNFCVSARPFAAACPYTREWILDERLPEPVE